MQDLHVDVLSRDETEHLLAWPDRDGPLGLRDAAVLGALYWAAATAGEVVALNVGDVDLRRSRLTLRGESGGRRVPVEPELGELLAHYRKDARRLMLLQEGRDEGAVEAFFLGNRRQRIRVQDIRQILGSAVKGAGITSPVNLTTLRLSRAWHLREEGKPPQEIQRLLGAESRSGRRLF